MSRVIEQIKTGLSYSSSTGKAQQHRIFQITSMVCWGTAAQLTSFGNTVLC